MQQPRTRFVLIETSHAGNVGAVARAMKVMGFDDLVLVRPRWPDVLERSEAIERASGAADVLARARCVATLDEALHGMTHLCATAMTPRDFGPPTRAPRVHFDLLLNQELPALDGKALEHDFAHESDETGAPHPSLSPEGRGRSVAPVLPRVDHQAHVPLNLSEPQGVAMLFGPERYGMANDDVYRCHCCLSIPTDPAYGSLNLAAAVQLIAYDWRQALAARGWGFGVQPAVAEPLRADAAQQAGMLAHWQSALIDIGFLDPDAPKKLMPRLTQLFNRAQPTVEEIHILRGIAKAMQAAAGKRRKR